MSAAPTSIQRDPADAARPAPSAASPKQRDGERGAQAELAAQHDEQPQRRAEQQRAEEAAQIDHPASRPRQHARQARHRRDQQIRRGDADAERQEDRRRSPSVRAAKREAERRADEGRRAGRRQQGRERAGRQTLPSGPRSATRGDASAAAAPRTSPTDCRRRARAAPRGRPGTAAPGTARPSRRRAPAAFAATVAAASTRNDSTMPSAVPRKPRRVSRGDLSSGWRRQGGEQLQRQHRQHAGHEVEDQVRRAGRGRASPRAVLRSISAAPCVTVTGAVMLRGPSTSVTVSVLPMRSRQLPLIGRRNVVAVGRTFQHRRRAEDRIVGAFDKRIGRGERRSCWRW